MEKEQKIKTTIEFLEKNKIHYKIYYLDKPYTKIETWIKKEPVCVLWPTTKRWATLNNRKEQVSPHGRGLDSLYKNLKNGKKPKHKYTTKEKLLILEKVIKSLRTKENSEKIDHILNEYFS